MNASSVITPIKFYKLVHPPPQGPKDLLAANTLHFFCFNGLSGTFQTYTSDDNTSQLEVKLEKKNPPFSTATANHITPK